MALETGNGVVLVIPVCFGLRVSSRDLKSGLVAGVVGGILLVSLYGLETDLVTDLYFAFFYGTSTLCRPWPYPCPCHPFQAFGKIYSRTSDSF
jgi:hypothetical protein